MSLLDDPRLAPILQALPRARLVGGCVRDMLAGRAVTDVDLATPDPPEAIQRAIEAAGLRAVPTGMAHGTVTALSGGRAFEITTLRRDVRTDGRHADVAWTDDWQEDAARRDFTINAMSLDRDGGLHDYFGGEDDLALGRVRFVGHAATRIAEDYLRVLRFFRFFGRYGQGEADREAVQAIGASAGELGRLSPERVWSELKRILAMPDPRPVLSLMQQLGVLSALLPDAENLPALDRLAGAAAPPDPLLRLGAMLTGDPGSLALRLRLSNAERDRLAAMRGGAIPAAGDDDAALRRLLADTPASVLIDRLFLAGAPERLRARLLAIEPPVFPLEGRDLLALGMAPGPEVGRTLAAVRQWWLDGGCLADRAGCLELLRI